MKKQVNKTKITLTTVLPGNQDDRVMYISLLIGNQHDQVMYTFLLIGKEEEEYTEEY